MVVISPILANEVERSTRRGRIKQDDRPAHPAEAQYCIPLVANRRKSVRRGISRNFEAGNLLEISTESISNPCVSREGTGLRYQRLRSRH